MLGVEHEITPSQFDEYAVKQEDFPNRESYVQAVAAGKILEVAFRHEVDSNDLAVLGGDLMTFVGDRTFHKPKNYEQAREFMRSFLGGWHDEVVATGVWYQGKLEIRVSTSRVYTPPFSEEQLKSYLQIASPLDKSGGYSIGAAIRTVGKHGVEKVKLEGHLTTVLGMNLFDTAELLRQAGLTVPAKEAEVEAAIEQDVFSHQA